MKKVNNLNLKNNVKTMSKKRNAVLLSTASVIATVPIATTVGVTVNNNNVIGGPVNYGGREFSSVSQLMSYVDGQTKKVVSEGLNSKWILESNGVKKEFSSPEALKEEVLRNNNVKELTVKSDVDLINYVDPKTGAFTNPQVWEHIADANATEKTIYQGNNDQIYNDQENAYSSYFLTKEAFYFNGIYFNTKEELRNYLQSQYFPNLTTNANTVILKSPNGNSYPIDLSRPDAIATMDQFIRANAEITLALEKGNNTQIINRNNLEQMVDQVSLSDLDYLHIQSNQGQSRYIIDNYDGSNLIGPYFYNGVLDVGSFMNKNMWRKVTGVSKLAYVESKADAAIGTFFSSILNDDNNINMQQADGVAVPLLFRTLLTAPDGKSSYDKWFLEELSKLSPKLSEALIFANNSMMMGKKYNTFFKIPVLYSFLMQRAVTWNLGNDVISLIVDYFTNVCNYIQDVLEFGALNNKEIFKSKDGQSYFNMKDFFQIGNPEYDINTSTEYFLNEFKTKYPTLVLYAASYLAAENNIVMTAGMIPYAGQDFSYLVEAGIFQNETELSKTKILLEPTYNMFSTLNFNDMLKAYITNNKDPQILNIKNLPEAQWAEEIKKVKITKSNISLDVLISGIGAKNNQYIQLANSVLRLEIKTYLETKAAVVGGYLEKLYDNNPRFDRMATFINLVGDKLNDSSFDIYRVYLAFLFEKKLNSYNFTSEVAKNPSLFAQRLSSMILMTFGSSLLVGNALRSVYTGSDKLGTPMDAPILTLFKTRDENLIDDLQSELSYGSTSSSIGGSSTTSGGTTDTDLPWYPDLDDTPPGTPDTERWPTPPTEVHTELDLEEGRKQGKIKKLTAADIDIRLFNPKLHDKNADINWAQKIYLYDLGEFITDSSPDWSDDVLKSVIDYNKNTNIRWDWEVTTFSNPLDEVNSFISKEFNFIDEFAEQLVEEHFIEDKLPIVRPDLDWDGSRPSTPDSSWFPDLPDFSDGNNIDTDRWPTPPSLDGDWTDEVRPDTPHSKPNLPESFETQKKSWFSGTKTKMNKMFNAFKEGAEKVLNFAVEIFGGVFAALEIGFFIFDLLREEHIQEFYQYVTPDGTSFYWDGGLTVTKYFGLQVNTIHDISEMKLINPVQITLPQIEEFKFFDGMKYYDNRELKRAVLSNYLNGGTIPTQSNFKKYYSLLNGQDPYKSATIDELKANVIKSLNITEKTDGSYDTTRLDKKSIYVQSTSNSFNAGYIISKGDNNVTLTDNIYRNIRPTYLTVLPDVQNNIATGNVSKQVVYPGKYWNGTTVVTNDPSTYAHVLVDNSANALKAGITIGGNMITQDNFVEPDQTKASKASQTALYDKFKTSFNIASKNILGTSNITNKYSDISGNINTQKIYQVTNSNGKVTYFYNLNAVSKNIYGNYKIYKNVDKKTQLLFDDKYFNNRKEVENYVLSNSKKL